MNSVKYDIHPEAQADYEEHLLFYATNGLTYTSVEDFRAEIESALEEISAKPLTYRLVKKSGKQRRLGPTRRFHFVIYYTVKADGVTPYILAISHPSRKPGYWTYRA